MGPVHLHPEAPRSVRILAISGSLRAASLNSALLRAAARIAPADIEIAVFGQLGDLPLFNPDLDPESIETVETLRRQIIAADALLVASPEYAHGVTGVMKNALDWMVGNESFVDKPIALLNASPRATHAQAALRETVRTMSARLIDDASITLPILGSGLDEDAIARHGEIRTALLDALHVLAAAVRSLPSEDNT